MRTRTRGGIIVWALVTIALLVVPYLVWVFTRFTGSDEGLRKHLEFELAATTTMYPGKLSIALRFEAHGKSVSLHKRAVVVYCDGREIRGRACAEALPADQPYFRLALGVHDGSRDIYYWHVPTRELDAWLGGPGKHVVELQVGPVKSNPITITLPGPTIESPDFELVQQ